MADESITGTLTMPVQSVGLRPVGDLNFHIGDRQYTFAPDKVQPRDTGYLLLLFAALLAQRSLGPLDTWTFVNEHQLWHCFKER